MPSGAKKRRAAKRKKQEEAQTKQTDELTTVSIVKLSIPIEELTKGAVYHEAASVDKELEQSNQSIGVVFGETKAATVDDNVIEENEFPLLNIISNEDNVVSNDVPVVSQNADCITESKESGENLKENEFPLLNIISNEDNVVSNVVPVVSQNSDCITESKESGENLKENEFPLLNIISNEDNVVSNDVPVVSQNADCITESKESGENLKENESLGVVCVDTKETEMKDSLLVPAVSSDGNEIELLTGEPHEDIVEKVDDSLSYAMSPEEMWEKYHDLLSETDTTILDYDKNRGFFLREAELPVVVAQPTSNEDVKEIPPNSAENTVCSSAEIVFDSKETQAVSTITVSPATENQAHFASPVPCNPECTAIKETLVNLMARVGEFESSIHTFKEDLQKTLDKLNANSF